MADDHCVAQRRKEPGGVVVVEFRHLDEGGADGVRHVGITSGAGEEPVRIGVVGRPSVEVLERRLGVTGLDCIDEPVADQRVERRLGQPSTHRIERMRHVHDPTLGADGGRRLARRQAGRNPLAQEQTDDLTGVRPHLLPYHDPTGQLVEQVQCPGDGVVVGDAEHVDAGRRHRGGKLVGRRRRVTGPHRVTVQVDANGTGAPRLTEMRVARHRLRSRFVRHGRRRYRVVLSGGVRRQTRRHPSVHPARSATRFVVCWL